MIVRVFCLILLLIICGCQDSAIGILGDDAGWLYEASPRHDFEESVKNSDYRFIGIYEYSLTVPGVHLKCINISKDVKPIEGTSDSYSTYEEEKFNVIAKLYASHYNFQLRKYLEGKKLFSCEL